MKIVSVTHSNREDDLIVDALKSVVNLVDACIVINTTGKIKDYSFEESVVGDKLIKEDFRPLKPEDSAVVKNYDLIMAKKHGANWALLVDTDERIICNVNLREALEKVTADLVISWKDDGQYSKERIIKIPAVGMFDGVAHEAFMNPNRTTIDGLSFSELPKSPEDIKSKSEIVAKCLEDDLKKNPNNPRNRQYLGSTYIALNRYEDAIEQFKYILNYDSDSEMATIAHTFTGYCYFELKKFKEAIDICIMGLRYLPTAELFFIISYSYLLLGDFRMAVCFAELSVAAGELKGYEPTLNRLAARNTPILYELPFEIMIKVYEDIKHQENLEFFKKVRDNAKNKRLAKYAEATV